MAESDATAQSWRFVGRVNPDTNELTWPSTGVSFAFVGTTASIEIDSQNGTSSVDLFIDDDEPIVIPNLNSTSISTPKLKQGHHDVELRKRSEAYHGTFRVADVHTDGAFVRRKKHKRTMEIIGDSITVGYGLDGVLPCADTAAVQNNPKTYGALAANALEAEYSVVAWSGKGLTRSYPGPGWETEPTMPTLYSRYGALDEDNSYTYPSSWNPDAVVINLGTNDFAYLGERDPVDPADLQRALTKFIETIHSHYPDAHFFLVSSTMLNDAYPTAEDAQHTTHAKMLQDTIAQLDGIPATFVEWAPQGSDVGCDYHPNAATQAHGAALLEKAIRDALGWG